MLRRLVQAVRQAVAAHTSDAAHGTRTAGRPAPGERLLASHGKVFGERREVLRPRQLDRLLRALGLPSGSIVVVLGCGRGRALLVAARQPGVAGVVGVEPSPHLCARARANAAAYRRRHPGTCAIVVVDGEVSHYRPAAADTVFLLLDRLGPPAVERLAAALLASRAGAPRTVLVVTAHADDQRALDATGSFPLVLAGEVDGTPVAVHRAAVDPPRAAGRPLAATWAELN